MSDKPEPTKTEQPAPATDAAVSTPAPDPEKKPEEKVAEIGGRGGLDPTRYGDWEINGRCVDF